MSAGNSTGRKAQLGKTEREQLEKVVVDLREKVEEEIEYELEHHYKLIDREDGKDLSEEELNTRERLVEAIDHENPDDKSWGWCYEQYITGVGYTIVNRLAAFRCMEVRGFLDRPVTQLGDSGLTPAAERILGERFDLDRDDAIIAAYHNECEQMADELELLFDPNSRYSVIDPDADLYRELIHLLDGVADDIWRADDVLGWVYEYYNRPIIEDLDDKDSLEPEEVAPANQFYTPHWVVRLLTDNSLGRLYLESEEDIDSVIESQAELTIEERKKRDQMVTYTSDVGEFCTYLLPNVEPGATPDLDHPRELEVFDPACGSGHFLLYAFDVLERIWRKECPDMDYGEIPSQILEHNLYGVDLDLRACQLAAFNLYLKARERAEAEGNNNFQFPQVGIVTADASVANMGSVEKVFGEVAAEGGDVDEGLQQIFDSFENIEALGTLLDVRGTMEQVFDFNGQPSLEEAIDGGGSVTSFLDGLQDTVEDRYESDTFAAEELKSFLRLLLILARDYDVALMNPPYGSRGRMPDDVQDYVEEEYDNGKKRYKYTTEYYINFFEVCDKLVEDEGRIGMLVPRSFMFKRSYNDFRSDFIGDSGEFDFLAELGLGVLDKATVRPAATVVRSGTSGTRDRTGQFFRAHDASKGEKERKVLEAAYGESTNEDEVQRYYEKDLSEFKNIPGSPISYWVSENLRNIYDSDIVFDAENARVEKDSLGVVKQGLATANDSRFVRYFWETDEKEWVPIAKGGEDAWTVPRIQEVVLWGENGDELRQYDGSVIRNPQYYFQKSITYNRVKESGRRFGYLNSDSVFGDKGPTLIPERDIGIWNTLSYANSSLVTYLMLAQTPERMWEVGEVSKLPWDEGIAEMEELEPLARDAAANLLAVRSSQFTSPYYSGPLLLRLLGMDEELHLYDHPHRDLLESISPTEPDQELTTSASIEEVSSVASDYLETVESNLAEIAARTDEKVFEQFGVDDDQREVIFQEIDVRTSDDWEQGEGVVPTELEPIDNEGRLVKDLLMHITLEAVHESDDGIIPVATTPGSDIDTLIEMVRKEFQRLFGDNAETHLSEVDQILGNRQPQEVAYPNLERWLREDFFEYHLDRFENTPVVWRLTTERTVQDPEIEAFGCFVDYHQLDEGLVDRLSTGYLDVVREEYQNRMSTANTRRNDDTLPTVEVTEAEREYQRYLDAVEQLGEFEERLLALLEGEEREWSDETQAVAEETTRKVQTFTERTRKRFEMVDELREVADEDTRIKMFSEAFFEKVDNRRNEWLDLLEQLETACEAYSGDSSSPVEAHLYDLLDNVDDIIGGTYHNNKGVLSLNFYFRKGEEYLENGEPRNGMDEEYQLFAELAVESERDVELGEDIMEDCNNLVREISSEWGERAYDEILAGGWTPIHKHGVEMNITPLAESEVVPECVEDDVL